MNILLIAPASERWRHVGKRKYFNGKTFRFSMLSLLAVAAESPPDVNIRMIDEQVDEIPWDDPLDLIGITCMTAAAPRAYEIADRFRKRSIPVVLGGMHPTFCPEEAGLHADAIVLGDAEGIWAEVVNDARNRCLKHIYDNTQLHSLKGLRHLPRSLLAREKYRTIHAVQATRGCPKQCDFCSVSAFHQATQRQRPIEEVIAEIANIPSRFFMFIDDNLTADKEYSTQLFRALIPLRKRWVTQSTIAMAEDLEFVRLVAKAGCVGVFIGIETFSEKNLETVNKSFNRVEKYREAVATLHAHGIGVEVGIVFGFDHDDPHVFERTLKAMDKLKIDAAQISIFTPLPGTPRFKAMKNRIIDFDWSHYDFHHAVFQPGNMSAQNLKDGHDWVTNRFYSLGRIIRRACRYMLRPVGLSTLLFFLSVNLAYYGRIRTWKIKGLNPVYSKKVLPRSLNNRVFNRLGRFDYNGLKSLF
jgi:radical SAM superfamily enzyme YgiQ (UPF0313 family)